MRVLLISANREDVNMVTLPLGLAFVAASVQRSGHDVELLDLMRVEAPAAVIRETINRFHPQVIGVSVRNIDDQNMTAPRFFLPQVKEVLAVCRENSEAPLVLGGAGYSIFPQAALNYLEADFGIHGEGEWAFVELLKRLEAQEDLDGLPGFHRRDGAPAAPRKLSRSLDDLPWLEVAHWLTSARQDPSLMLPVQTRRGCPMRCSYCSTPSIEGNRIRKCSPEKAAAAVASYVNAGFQRMFFSDNTFNLPPSYAKAFCRALIAEGVRPAWNCIIYPGRLDGELVNLMTRAGCTNVSLGFESGSEAVLGRLNKRFTRSDIVRDRRLLADAGIATMGFLLLGVPGETRETVLESLELIDRIEPEMVRVTVGARIYPRTDLGDYALKMGLIAPGDDLLYPRFYVEPGLEEWLLETVGAWASGRKNCLTDFKRS